MHSHQCQGQTAIKVIIQTIQCKELKAHPEGLLAHYGKITKYLLSPYYEPGIILGVKDTAVNKPSKKIYYFSL